MKIENNVPPPSEKETRIGYGDRIKTAKAMKVGSSVLFATLVRASAFRVLLVSLGMKARLKRQDAGNYRVWRVK